MIIPWQKLLIMPVLILFWLEIQLLMLWLVMKLHYLSPLDQMIYHASSVVRAIERALVVVDLPFGTYQGNSRQALDSAIRIMKESGGHSVKLEGGAEISESITQNSFGRNSGNGALGINASINL